MSEGSGVRGGGGPSDGRRGAGVSVKPGAVRSLVVRVEGSTSLCVSWRHPVRLEPRLVGGLQYRLTVTRQPADWTAAQPPPPSDWTPSGPQVRRLRCGQSIKNNCTQ